MKVLISALIALAAAASLAFAAGRTESGGGSLFVMLFLGFGALIILYQLVPGIMMLGSIVRGLFPTAPKE
jgi:hypothetical protein